MRTFSQLRLLPSEEALKGLPARFEGTVLCYDAAWGQLYVHDGSEVKYFSPLSFPTALEAGMRVQITGTTMLVENSVGLTNLHLVAQGRAELPHATALGLSDLAREFGQWVEVSGRVRVAETSRGRLGLLLEDQGQHCLVFVMGTPPAEASFKRFVGARVQVRGINASKISKGQLQSATLHAPGLSEVTVLEPAKDRLERVPTLSIDSLLNRPLGAWTNDMVHINGFIAAYEPGSFVQVKDATGTMRVQVIQVTRAALDDWVDAWGFLTVSPNASALRDGYFELVRERTAEAPEPAPPARTEHAAETNRILTRIADVIRLSNEEAARGLPVRLHGTITFADAEWHNAFLEAADAAVYVDLKQPEVRAGQWVELTGRTAKGGFAPEVDDTTIRVLGMTNLPSPAQVNLTDLADGRWDAHWIEMEGTVRRVQDEWGHVTLSLVSPRGRFKAIIAHPSQEPSPDYLVDALVRVRGACSSELNARGQFSGVSLHVPGLEHIQILQAAPTDPFGVRTVPINTISTYDPERLVGHRVKIAGIVTLRIAGQGFYIQDASGGIRVSTQQTSELHLGDVVEVLGFPALGDFAPRLEEATFRRAGTARLPKPKRTTADQILLRGSEDGRVVQLEARLLGDIPRSAWPRLVLQDGPFIFTARAVGQAAGGQLPAWKSGTVVRLTGVCDIQGSENHEPAGFRVLLRGAGDLALVWAPSWWTASHALMLAGGLSLAIVASVGWIESLRRQVRVQTAEIRQQHEQTQPSLPPGRHGRSGYQCPAQCGQRAEQRQHLGRDSL